MLKGKVIKREVLKGGVIRLTIETRFLLAFKKITRYRTYRKLYEDNYLWAEEPEHELVPDLHVIQLNVWNRVWMDEQEQGT